MTIISCALLVDVNLADGSYVLVPEANIYEQEGEVEETPSLEETFVQDPNLSLSTANPADEGKPRFLHNLLSSYTFIECLCLCAYVLGIV